MMQTSRVMGDLFLTKHRNVRWWAKLMREWGWSQQATADMLGVSQPAVNYALRTPQPGPRSGWRMESFLEGQAAIRAAGKGMMAETIAAMPSFDSVAEEIGLYDRPEDL